MISVNLALKNAAEFRLHPLGFFYFRLDGDSISTRFHIWPRSEFGVPENDCHQHSFDIRSLILAGRMRSEIFNFLPAPGGSENEFAVTYGDGSSSLRPTGRVGSLDRVCEFDSSVGDTYFLGAGTIHRVSITRRPCVTTLETTDRHIPVFSYGNDNAEPAFDRRRVSHTEISEIQKILEPLLPDQAP